MTLWSVAGDPSALQHFLSVAGRFLVVLIGINALIIVHEFGHFIVARMCGVRCEKFYIWFDAWGFKFFSFKLGGTEYGLGWLPLGGYVKMLGQEDNPGAIKEEIERAKKEAATDTAVQQSESAAVSNEKVEKLEKLQSEMYAPDSYLSKNVFQRMAIISAGVIMNVIFAVICAAGAFMIGFPETTSRIGTVMPATGAWTAGIRAGDTIVEMNGKPVTLFAQIPYGLINGGEVSAKIARDGVAEPISVEMSPKREKDGLMPIIGVLPATSLRLAEIKRPYDMTLSPEENEIIEKRFGALSGGDKLVSMNGEKVETPGDYERLSRKYLNKPIEFVFAPTDRRGEVKPEEPTKTVTVPAVRAVDCGVRLTMGEIVAIQAGSPAEQAGLKARVTDANGVTVEAGDVITAIDGEPVVDPLTLETNLFHRAGNTAVVTVLRGGESLDIPVSLTANPGYTGLLGHNGALSSDALGAAYWVEPMISGVDPSVTVQGGDKPLGATIEKIAVKLPQPGKDIPETMAALYELLLSYGKKTSDGFEIAADSQDAQRNRTDVLDWFAQSINHFTNVAELEITARQKDGALVTLKTKAGESDKIFRIDRGLLFGVDTRTAKAPTFVAALDYGWDKTVESMGLVFRVLKNIGRNVSAKAFGGPGMIVGAAWTAAGTGDGLFLIFLCVIGANLAVVNILPIPVLDGGHLVFLLYEMIFRKPANETVQVVLSFIGLFLLLTLMAWVILLDIARFAGWL